jgi:hypothetical protein
MLLLAGHGLLMVIQRAGLVFLRLGFFSSLGLARVDGVTTFLMSSGSFFAFRPPLRMAVVLIGPHCVMRLSGLDASTISANLLRVRFDTIRRGRFRISHVGFGNMLVFSWAVADALERTITIRRPRLIRIGTDNFFSIFVLSGSPTRLPDIYK